MFETTKVMDGRKWRVAEPVGTTGGWIKEEIERNMPVNSIHRKVVPCRNPFITITGHLIPSMLLSQIVFWTDHSEDSNDGYFYKADRQWRDELGIGRRSVESARVVLIALGIIQYKIKRAWGEPEIYWYRLNLPRLATLLDQVLSGEYAKEEGRRIWAKRTELKTLFRKVRRIMDPKCKRLWTKEKKKAIVQNANTHCTNVQ